METSKSAPTTIIRRWAPKVRAQAELDSFPETRRSALDDQGDLDITIGAELSDSLWEDYERLYRKPKANGYRTLN